MRRSDITRNLVKEQGRLKDLFRAEYLGLYDHLDKLEVINPFENLSEADVENPHLHFFRLIRDPRYIGFTCKNIFNINLPPLQIAILQELWRRKYPMLVGNRGLGKSWL